MMMSSLVVWLVVLAGEMPLVAARQASLKIRGVNLGGWLVLEKWIKPSLFADWDPFLEESPKDEWTLCETLGTSACKEILEEHWDTWVTEADMDLLAEAGITHVRVPTGYWITGDVQGDEPYATGQWKYLVRMARWARERRIQVWLDMHAAPGSQNGFDNSGRLGNATWDQSTGNVNRTLGAVEWMAKMTVTAHLQDVITGFGLLNEPDNHINYWRMLGFYNDAYAIIRDVLGDSVSVYIGDMFNPQSFNWYWHDGNPIEATNVFLDTHIYACFVDDLKAMTPKQHITQVCRYERAHVNLCCWDGWPPAPTELGRFVGEWTAAFDRTPSPELQRAYANTIYLDNKKKKQAEKHDDESSSSFLGTLFGGGALQKKDEGDVLKYILPLTPQRYEFLKQYVLAQMATYEATPEDSKDWLHPRSEAAAALDFHGWFYWNFKMEADVYQEWDYLRGVREGWIPKLARGLSIEEQFGLTCADLEREATDCTNGVVDPFPPIAHWVGVPCDENGVPLPKIRERYAAVIFLFFLSIIAFGAAIFTAAHNRRPAYFFDRTCRFCCRRGPEYQRIKDQRDFTVLLPTNNNNTKLSGEAAAN